MLTNTLDVVVGYPCNNNCIFCLNPLTKKKSLKLSEIKAKLSENAGKFDKVEFIGGEPTIRKDIFEMVFFAKKLGYKSVRISTNGRMYAYPAFCRKISEAGANSVSFSLYGSNEKIHDATTRTPGSFKNSIKGIINALKEEKIKEVFVDTVVYKVNYQDIGNIADLLIDLGVKRWQICDLIPEGVAYQNYNSLYVSLSNLTLLNNFIDKLNNFNFVSFVDFPNCVFNKCMREKEKVRISTIKDRTKTFQVGCRDEKIFFDDYGEFEDKYKIKVQSCRGCSSEGICGGIWRRYFKLVGDKEIKKLKESNEL